LYPFEIPGNVAHALHVVAEHEDTPGFSPVLYPEREGFLQVRSPGDHSEVLRGPESLKVAQTWLKHLGIPLSPEPKHNGWGEPSRELSALRSFWEWQAAQAPNQ
jgi:hypothetical protein